jgi:hypothetical protein
LELASFGLEFSLVRASFCWFLGSLSAAYLQEFMVIDWVVFLKAAIKLIICHIVASSSTS